MTGALLGALVIVVGTFVEFRPNRVLSGDPASAVQSLGLIAWALLVAWALVLVLSLVRQDGRIAIVRGMLANGIALGALAGAARAATAFTAAQGDLARVSLGGSFWLTLLGCYVVGFGALQYLPGRLTRSLVAWSGAAGAALLLLGGQLSSLGVVREYLRDTASFWQAFGQQVSYTVGATLVALVLGLALGILAARRRRVEGPVFGVVNVLQVLPTLSFIGLLIAPMAWLGSNVAIFDAIGVSGIGWAPVFVVLCAYAVYPVTRNAYSAMKTLDHGVVDAARGIGMRPAQRFARIELPLAFPVVLAGVRIAAVQTAAGAIVAGLVGGGGLGKIVFLGLQQTATDMMLLGVIPIVALALALDATLRGAQGLFSADITNTEVSAA